MNSQRAASIARTVLRLGSLDDLKEVWKVPHYPRFWFSLFLSSQANRAMSIAQAWLLAGMGAGPAMIGYANGASAMSKLLMLPITGAVGDRMSRSRLLSVVLLLQGLPYGLLAVLVWRQALPGAWLVIVIATVGSVLNAVAQAPKAGYTDDLIATGDVALHSRRLDGRGMLDGLSSTAAKALTPFLAALLIDRLGGGDVGIAVCFALGALAFAAQWYAVRNAPASEPIVVEQRRGIGTRWRGLRSDWREALSAVGDRPAAKWGLISLAIVSLLAFNINVVLPVVAYEMWRGTPWRLAWLLAAFGLGSMFAALHKLPPPDRVLRCLLVLCSLLAVSMSLATLPMFVMQMAMVSVMGFAAIALQTTVKKTLSLNAAPGMRTRYNALHALAYDGTTAFGGPIAGLTMMWLGARAGFAIGALGAMIGIVVLLAGMRAVARADDAIVPDVSA